MVSLDRPDTDRYYDTGAHSSLIRGSLFRDNFLHVSEKLHSESGQAPNMLNAEKSDAIEKSLSCKFKLFAWVLLGCVAINTFFTTFHEFDEEDSEKTDRYEIGFWSYMVLFFIQSVILVGIFIFAIVVYCRFASILRPSKKALGLLAGVSVQDSRDDDEDEDDIYIKPEELALEAYREAYRPNYFKNNIYIMVFLFLIAVRTGLYLYLRFNSKEALLHWDFINPIYFYIIFVNDTILTIGILYFIGSTTF